VRLPEISVKTVTKIRILLRGENVFEMDRRKT
jgi:hypothetical protein